MNYIELCVNYGDGVKGDLDRLLYLGSLLFSRKEKVRI